MPKRKRRDKRPVFDGPPIDPSVALFAKRHTDAVEAQKAEQRAAAAERRRAEEHQRLLADKDRAAARLKDLRARDRKPAGAVEEADAAYKAALAALIEFETGAPPAWASATTDESDPEAEPEIQREEDGT